LTRRQDLVKIKSKALRARIWFSALSKVERTIIDLTIKCVEKVRSTVLASTISAIVNKILPYLQGDFMTEAEKVGQGIVERLCIVGGTWGNKTCSTWRSDRYFVRFMGVNTLNI